MSPNRALRIGYLMQEGVPDLQVSTGASLHIRAVVRDFQKRGHHVRVLRDHGGRCEWSEDLQQFHPATFRWSQMRCYRLFRGAIGQLQTQWGMPYLNLLDGFHFADACRNTLTGCDVLYERYGFSGYGGAIAARWMRVPLILEVNGDPFQTYERLGIREPRVQFALAKVLTRLFLRMATVVVCPSQELSRHMEAMAGLRPSKVRTVLNGTDVDLFARPYDGLQTWRQFGLGPDLAVTYVGGFQPWHGLDILLSSFVSVLQEIWDVQLVLAGDGPQLEKIEQQVRRLGLQDKVKFLGRLPVEQVAPVVACSDVVVAPYQGWVNISGSIKVLDYMAAGRAIVATANNGKHEVIEDGVTGVLVEPGDADELASAIMDLLGNEERRRALGCAAQRRAIARHSWDCTVAQLEEICYGVIRDV